MARRYIEVFEDDMEKVEGPTVKTRSFGFNGTEYEIDLNDKNYEKLAKALQPFMDAARVAKRDKPKGSKSKPKTTMTDADRRKANEDARCYGQIVMQRLLKQRGRVPGDVMKAWDDAGRPNREQTLAKAQAIVDKHVADNPPAEKRRTVVPARGKAKQFEAKQGSMIEEGAKRNGGSTTSPGAANKRAAKKAVPKQREGGANA